MYNHTKQYNYSDGSIPVDISNIDTREQGERCREAAHIYLEMGMGPVPLFTRSKILNTRLAYPQCFERLPTHEEIDQWWQQEPDAHVGIAAGVNNVRILDFEEKSAWNEFKHVLTMHDLLNIHDKPGQYNENYWIFFNNLTTNHLLANSFSGRHLYFRATLPDPMRGDRYIDLAWFEERPYINLLVQQRYVVAPPSIVTSKNLIIGGYTWNTDSRRYTWTYEPINDPVPLMDLDTGTAAYITTACKLLGDGSWAPEDYDVDYESWEDDL